MKTIVLVVGILILGGSTRLHPGDCIQDISTGFIWRIVGSDWLGQYSAQAWLGDGKPWGLVVPGLSLSNSVKIICPFSDAVKPN